MLFLEDNSCDFRVGKKCQIFAIVCLTVLYGQILFVSSMNAVHPSSHHHALQEQKSSPQRHDGPPGFGSNTKTSSKTSLPIQTSSSNRQKNAVWNELPFSVTLEPDERLVYSWDWNEASASDDETKVATIQVRAKVNKQAWIAIGFSNNGSLNNADFCVVFPDTHSSDTKRRMLMYDGWTDEEGVMHVDAQQDCRLLESYFDAHAQLVLRYERAFDTCDDPFDYVIEDGTTHVVYALGVGPINSIEGLRLNDPQHVYGGFERVTFPKPHLPTIMYPSDTRIIDITAAQVHVPGANDTTYWCIVQKMPDLTTKNHIVRYEAVITPGSEDLVHHIEVFHCELPVKTKVPTYQGLCHAANRPKELDRCTRVIGAWAMGAPPLEYPPNAGYPIGGEQSSYVLVEIHYNNPQHRTGIPRTLANNSGIRFYVSATPRPYDIGVMELGLEYTPKMSIPPNAKSMLLHGHCIAECTQAGFPPEGIVIFASQLHTHLTGVRVKTRHIRNGLELPLLNGDNHFNSMFQEIRRLRRPVRVLPGDELLTTCEYTTLDRSKVTLGGFGISDEMCVNYVHYYPRTNLEVCKSSVDSNALADFFEFLRIQNGDEHVDSVRNSVEENYMNVRYTPLVAGLQSQFYDQAPLAMQCNKSDGTRFAGSWNRQHQIRIDRPLSTPKRVCPSPALRLTQNRYSEGRGQPFNENGDDDSTSAFWRRLSLPKLLLVQPNDNDNQTSFRRQVNHDTRTPNFALDGNYNNNAQTKFIDEFSPGKFFKDEKPQKTIVDRLFSKASAPTVTVKRGAAKVNSLKESDGAESSEISDSRQWAPTQFAHGKNQDLPINYARTMLPSSLNGFAADYVDNDASSFLQNYLSNERHEIPSNGEQNTDDDDAEVTQDDKHVPMLHMHG